MWICHQHSKIRPIFHAPTGCCCGCSLPTRFQDIQSTTDHISVFGKQFTWWFELVTAWFQGVGNVPDVVGHHSWSVLISGRTTCWNTLFPSFGKVQTEVWVDLWQISLAIRCKASQWCAKHPYCWTLHLVGWCCRKLHQIQTGSDLSCRETETTFETETTLTVHHCWTGFFFGWSDQKLYSSPSRFPADFISHQV